MADELLKKFDPKVCGDVLAFQDYLKRARTIDDTIILNMNTILVVTSQKDEKSTATKCTDFHRQLTDAYEGRDKVINLCRADAVDIVSNLKHLKASDELNFKLQKDLKREQNRLRVLEKELSVEQIIKDRSLKAFHERCRRYVEF